MSKSEYRIAGRISATEMPSLYRYLENLNMRTSHGRAMLCIVIDRAVALTPADKARYGAAVFGALRSIASDTKPRRLSISITRAEHPTTIDGLESRLFDPGNHSGFLHLMEVAAGLLHLDSLGMPLAAPVPPPAAPDTSAASAADQQKSPPLPLPATGHAMPGIDDAHNIISSADRGGGHMPLQAEDLVGLMGT